MKRDPKERGSRRQVLRRTGIGNLREWGGMVPDGHAASLGIREFRNLVNVRFDRGEITERGGQEKYNSGGALDGCVQLMIDLGEANDSSTKLWIGAAITGSSDVDVVSYHPTDSPTLQSVIEDAALSGPAQCFFIRDGKLHFFLDSSFYELNRVPAPTGDSMSEAAGTSHKKLFTPAAGIPASATTFDPGDGKTYFAADTIIYTWDGVSFLSDFASATGAAIIARYREDMFAAGTNEFRQRSGGTWGTIAMPGGLTAPVAVQGSWAVFLDKLYTGWDDDVGAGNHRDRILSWDGTTHALARSLTSGSNAQGILALVNFGGFLYYFYTHHNDGDLIVGRFDGSTFTDSHKNLGDQASVGNPTELRAVIPYAGSLYAVVTGAGGTRLIRSAEAATSSDWVSVATGLGTSTQNSMVIL